MRSRLALALLALALRPAALAAEPASLAAVRAVLPTWGNATHPGDASSCTSARVVDGGDTASVATGFFQNQAGAPANSNLIVWRDRLCSAVVPQGDACNFASVCAAGTYCPDCASKYGCWDDTRAAKTIALTTVTYDTSTGEIYDADMELWGWDGTAGSLSGTVNPLGNIDGWYFTCTDLPGGPGPAPASCPSGVSSPTQVCTCTDYGQSGCIYMDVQNTVTHELGHVLGLAHPDTFTGETMSATATPGETSKRVLSPSDVTGICTVYPKGYSPPSACVTSGIQGTYTAPDGYWKRTVSASTGCALWWRNPSVTVVLNQYGAGPSCGDPAQPAPQPLSTSQPARSSGGCATAGGQPAVWALLLGALALRRARRRATARAVCSTRRATPR